MTERTYSVPEGLDGQRLDQALSRMLGLSRSKAADLVDHAQVTLDGELVPKSARVLADQVIAVADLDEPPAPPPEMELPVLYADDDIIVVDKPVGMAAHASPGWEGPTVVGALARAGYRIAEVPITFVDRLKGTSKMSMNIFREALWGVLQMRFGTQQRRRTA